MDDLVLCVRGVAKSTFDQGTSSCAMRYSHTLRGDVSALTTLTKLPAWTVLAVLVDEFSEPEDVVELGKQICRRHASTYLLSDDRPAALFGSGRPRVVCDAIESADTPPFGPAAFVVFYKEVAINGDD